MSIINDLKSNKSSGYKKTIFLKHKDLGKSLGGLSTGRQDLIIGETGVGKSSFSIDTYVMGPFIETWAYNIANPTTPINMEILYFSFKLSKEEILAKCLAWLVKVKTNLVLDTNYILSKKGTSLSPKALEFISKFEDVMDKLESCLTVINKTMTPDDIKNYLKGHAEANGEVKVLPTKTLYFPKDKSKFTVVLVDSVDDLASPIGYSKYNVQENVTVHSNYCRDIYCNIYNYQVLNIASVERPRDSYRVRIGDLSPTFVDVEHKQLLSNSNVVISIFKPENYINVNTSMKKYMGYPVDYLRDNFRLMSVIKNSYNRPNTGKGFYYTGECSHFTELSKPTGLSTTEYEKHRKSIVVDGFTHTGIQLDKIYSKYSKKL